jgi:glycosyltransferase involved in cell wall biosynthesis
MMTDVALFLPRLEGGGAERAMINLAGGLAAAGSAVQIVLAKATGPFLAEVPEGVAIVDLDSSSTIAAIPALIRYLRRVRPAVVMSTLAHANASAVIACKLGCRGTRTYVREASTYPMDLPPGLRGRVLSAILPFLYRKADGVVAVSAGVADHVIATFGIDPRQVHVIYNPVIGPSLFEMAKKGANHPWLSPGEPPVILAVGSLKRAKDFPTLLRAFASVRQIVRTRLIVLGEGEDRNDLEILAQTLGVKDDVSLPGFVSNPFPYMSAAAVFVLSSKTEGLPNVLIQALALGRPAVATDCPSGPREICAGNPRARLVPVGNPAAMAGAILESLSLAPLEDAASEDLRRFHIAEVTLQFVKLFNKQPFPRLLPC